MKKAIQTVTKALTTLFVRKKEVSVNPREYCQFFDMLSINQKTFPTVCTYLDYVGCTWAMALAYAHLGYKVVLKINTEPQIFFSAQAVLKCEGHVNIELEFPEPLKEGQKYAAKL